MGTIVELHDIYCPAEYVSSPFLRSYFSQISRTPLKYNYQDIDISIRTSKKGYKNYYLAETYITHIKGESMKKNWKYIFHFYNSMMIFIKKYYFALIFIAWPVVYTMMFLHYIKYFLFNKN